MAPDMNTIEHKDARILHEERDFEEAVKRRANVNLDEWPNDAGFEGLTEVRGPVGLKVTGSIPSWAAGSLYRTGPGQYNVEDTPKGTFKSTHWFDGFAHTHKFEIIADPEDADAPARVEYSSRFQAEAYVESIRKAGRIPGLSFGQRQDPCVGIFGKVMSVFKRPDAESGSGSENICVTVQPDMPGLTPVPEQTSSGHRATKRTMFQTTDAALLLKIDPDTMEPIGVARQSQLHPLLKGPLSSAHAQRDPKTGDLFNYNLDMGRQSTYRVFRTSASTGETEILATISMPDLKPAYIHSFFLTPSFVVLCVPSTHLGYMGISVPWNGNIVDAIEPFDKSKLCRWFIVDRHEGRGVVATSETPAGFFFHSVNAFEDRDAQTGDVTISCDVVEYPSTDIIRAFEMDALLLGNKGNYTDTYHKGEELVRDCMQRFARHQFKIPHSDTKKTARDKPARVSSQKVLEFKSPYTGELPTINPAYATRKYRYVYSMASRGFSTLQDAIVKTDLVTREALTWQVDGHTPGEAIFVARPRNKNINKVGSSETSEDEEDDGVLLSVMLDGFGRKSYLVCLDAKTMQELGRAECDWAVGHGFHGVHLPGSRL